MTSKTYIETWAAGYVAEFKSLPDDDAAGFFLRLAHEAIEMEDPEGRAACQLALLTIEEESLCAA